jgi:hypothetical protein
VSGDRARVRVNLTQGEVEIEGSEAFVERYLDQFEALLAHVQGRPPETVETEPSLQLAGTGGTSGNGVEKSLPASFGEWLELVPRGATDVDRILIAGYFAQRRSGDQSFGTGEANTLLTDQGIKLGNPSQCVKQNLVAKRVFRHQRRYRVSQTGVDHIRPLLGPDFGG